MRVFRGGGQSIWLAIVVLAVSIETAAATSVPESCLNWAPFEENFLAGVLESMDDENELDGESPVGSYFELLPPFDRTRTDTGESRLILRNECNEIWAELFQVLYRLQFEERRSIGHHLRRAARKPFGPMMICTPYPIVDITWGGWQDIGRIFTNTCDFTGMDLRDEGQEDDLLQGMSAQELAVQLGFPFWLPDHLRELTPSERIVSFMPAVDLDDLWREVMSYTLLTPAISSADLAAFLAVPGQKVGNLTAGETALHRSMKDLRSIYVMWDLFVEPLWGESEYRKRLGIYQELQQRLSALQKGEHASVARDYVTIHGLPFVQEVRREADRYESLQLTFNQNLETARTVTEVATIFIGWVPALATRIGAGARILSRLVSAELTAHVVIQILDEQSQDMGTPDSKRDYWSFKTGNGPLISIDSINRIYGISGLNRRMELRFDELPTLSGHLGFNREE